MPILRITLYDPETGEERQTFTRNFVPWRLLKLAIQLSKSTHNTDMAEINADMADQIASLVVDAFGGQFTLDQVNECADLGEMMTVVRAIISRAQSSNPTRPG